MPIWHERALLVRATLKIKYILLLEKIDLKPNAKVKLATTITVLVILANLLLINQLGYLGPKLNIGIGTGTGTTTPTTSISGILTSSVAAYDTMNPATTRTLGSDVSVYWYAYRNGWVLLGTGTGTDLNILSSDNNVIYAVLSPSSSYYVDYTKIQQMNTRVQSVDYRDITGSGTQQFVFRLNIGDSPYASGTGKYNMPLFTVYLLTYDTGHAISNPSAITSIGNTTVTKFLAWYTTMGTSLKGIGISKIVLIVNSSDTTKAVIKTVNVPGLGNLAGSSFDQNIQTSQVVYTYKVSSILYGADYIQLPTNALNKFDFTTQIQFHLTSGDVLQWTLYIYYLDPTQSLTSVSGSCNCSE